MDKDKTLKYYKETLDIFNNLFKRHIEKARTNIIAKSSTEEKHKNGSFEFIPSSSLVMLTEFMALRKYLHSKNLLPLHNTQTKFLDAGCGIGNVMLLAKAVCLCAKIHGTELFDETIREGRKFLASYGYSSKDEYIKIMKADILKFKKYGDYDIIHYYCPFCNEELERKFEKRVEDQMKVGAILLPRGQSRARLERDSRFEMIVLKPDTGGLYDYPLRIFRKVSL